MSFPIDSSYTRDLSDPELWARSQSRAVHRREIAALSRKHAARRKGATLAVTASMAAGPTVLPLAALASSGSGSRSVATASAPARSSIHLPSGALVSEGDTGAVVVAIQRQVGVDDDGIFGPITRGAVEQFQSRWGLAVTGEVDAKTWAALFKSTVSYLGDGSNGGGKRVLATYHAPAAPTTREHASTPASSPDTAVAPAEDTAPASSPAAPKTVSAPAPAATGGGCGSGRIATPVSGTVTGSYGEARSGHAHAGEDIAAPSGTPVRAAQCGTVSQAGTESGYGNIVCIQHAGGVSTCYAHLSAIDVSKGANVHVGDVIGKVGCTGSCTGPHLHFEVRENGKATDPAPYLAGSKTIAGGTEAKATTAKPKATTAQPATATTASAETAPAQTAAAAAPAEAAPAAAPAETAPAPAPAETAPARGARRDRPRPGARRSRARRGAGRDGAGGNNTGRVRARRGRTLGHGAYRNGAGRDRTRPGARRDRARADRARGEDAGRVRTRPGARGNDAGRVRTRRGARGSRARADRPRGNDAGRVRTRRGARGSRARADRARGDDAGRVRTRRGARGSRAGGDDAGRVRPRRGARRHQLSHTRGRPPVRGRPLVHSSQGFAQCRVGPLRVGVRPAPADASEDLERRLRVILHALDVHPQRHDAVRYLGVQHDRAADRGDRDSRSQDRQRAARVRPQPRQRLARARQHEQHGRVIRAYDRGDRDRVRLPSARRQRRDRRVRPLRQHDSKGVRHALEGGWRPRAARPWPRRRT